MPDETGLTNLLSKPDMIILHPSNKALIEEPSVSP